MSWLGIVGVVVAFVVGIPAMWVGYQVWRMMPRRPARGGPQGAITRGTGTKEVAEISVDLLRIAQASLASGIDSAREVGLPIIPSVTVETSGKQTTSRFAMGTQDWALGAAREEASTASEKAVVWYYAAIEFSGVRQQAIVAECHERGMSSGVVFVQRFRGSGQGLSLVGGPERFALCDAFVERRRTTGCS